MASPRTAQMTESFAIIVAGGRGLRAGGGVGKQWAMLGDRRVIDWSIDACMMHGSISRVVIVGKPEAIDMARDDARLVWAPPGATRTGSVRNGLAALVAPADTKVLIHDAARPGLTGTMISALLEALDSADAAAPALPIADALKRSSGGRLESVGRDGLYRVQTPQAFRLGLIREALAASGTDLVDDLAAVESLGARITLVAGDARLHKITFPEDFDLVSRLNTPALAIPRVGKGFDVHGFEPGDHVTLCGVKIAHTAKLEGHSDADAAWHALTDAILGAMALGDIGDHFPPSDPQWRGADSGIFLKAAQDLALAHGYRIANCDITLICEAPKIKPHREAMRESTARLLGLPLDAVSVKATTTEGLGFTGRREGIAAEAIAVLAPSL